VGFPLLSLTQKKELPQRHKDTVLFQWIIIFLQIVKKVLPQRHEGTKFSLIKSSGEIIFFVRLSVPSE